MYVEKNLIFFVFLFPMKTLGFFLYHLSPWDSRTHVTMG